MEIAVGLALAFLFVGGLTFFGRTASARVKKALIATPDKRVQDARDGERGLFRGTAQPTREGPTASPSSGEAVLWWRVRVETRVPPVRTYSNVRAAEPPWQTLHASSAERDVVLEEPGGGRAQVAMDKALVRVSHVTTTSDPAAIKRVLKAVRAAKHAADDEPELAPAEGEDEGDVLPELDRFAAMPGAAVRLIEERLEQGAELFVIGTARRADSAAAQAAYRDAPDASVIVDGEGTGTDALLVATEELRALLAEDRFFE